MPTPTVKRSLKDHIAREGRLYSKPWIRDIKLCVGKGSSGERFIVGAYGKVYASEPISDAPTFYELKWSIRAIRKLLGERMSERWEAKDVLARSVNE